MVQGKVIGIDWSCDTVSDGIVVGSKAAIAVEFDHSGNENIYELEFASIHSLQALKNAQFRSPVMLLDGPIVKERLEERITQFVESLICYSTAELHSQLSATMKNEFDINLLGELNKKLKTDPA